jgi:hypothetical protein
MRSGVRISPGAPIKSISYAGIRGRLDCGAYALMPWQARPGSGRPITGGNHALRIFRGGFQGLGPRTPQSHGLTQRALLRPARSGCLPLHRPKGTRSFARRRKRAEGKCERRYSGDPRIHPMTNIPSSASAVSLNAAPSGVPTITAYTAGKKDNDNGGCTGN